MRIRYAFESFLAAATLCVVAATLMASPKAGPPDTTTIAVHQQDSQNHTWVLLQQIQQEAIDIRNNADQLQMLAWNPLVGWDDDGNILANLRDQVNKLDQLLSYVREHEAQASPLQRRTIDLMAPPSLELATTTQDAIVTLDNNKAYVYMTDLDGLAKDIYNEANRVDMAVGDLDKYMIARREEQQVKQSLGIK
ncbi:MAG TPA: hypothetical protein VMO17_01695 [Terriglobia bacterium]|nr:hypothetical protein [Terriglobia bacterium]